ncbi:MAG: hypothetical protein OJF52_003468 [Nitrospira sp.]|nr:MAG: hypothetical protein OJF52_003468 [Nitrospira sp.]
MDLSLAQLQQGKADRRIGGTKTMILTRPFTRPSRGAHGSRTVCIS